MMEKGKHFHNLSCQGITGPTSKNQVSKVLLISFTCKISLMTNFSNLQGIYLYLTRILPSELEHIDLFP